MFQAEYLPVITQHIAAVVLNKSQSTHRYVPVRSPVPLSRRSSAQVIQALRRLEGIQAQPYFIEGERATNYVLVDMAILAAKRNKH